METIIIFSCINNYVFGNKIKYSLPIFHCSEDSAIKGAKEIFNRSIKQIYIIILGMIAAILFFTNEKNSKYIINKSLIFFIGLVCIVLSEINSVFLSISLIKNIISIMLPAIIFVLCYLFLFNLSKKSI